ncbi:hypothetical protein B0H14DRAFT_3861724 [Mycena olivaceomarginata]|nr:hypothetical protein B0H14DRAFT_3861724 [Mycena olivaceomarginata]
MCLLRIASSLERKLAPVTAKIVKLQSLITVSAARDHAAVEQEHFRLRVLVAREEAVIAERDSLGRERATLSKDRDLVDTDRRSTVGALKCSVEFLQTQIAQQERAEQPPGIRNAGGPRRYRGIKASKDERDFRRGFNSEVHGLGIRNRVGVEE